MLVWRAGGDLVGGDGHVVVGGDDGVGQLAGLMFGAAVATIRDNLVWHRMSVRMHQVHTSRSEDPFVVGLTGFEPATN
jgi:hypothetical protein